MIASLPIELECRITQLLALIPVGSKSILDVGSSHGYLTNRLAAPRVIGSDVERERLKDVVHPTVQASAAGLPFASGSFNLVICTEVLEHLPIPVYEMALRELPRVSQRFILVSVPDNEFLDVANTRCSSCGQIYHVHGHVRSFSEVDLGKIFPGWDLARLVNIQGKYVPWNKVLLRIRQSVGGWSFEPLAVCPFCGSPLAKTIRHLSFFRRCVVVIINVFNNLLQRHSDYGGWLIALYVQQV